jgi:exoribonuclease-2
MVLHLERGDDHFAVGPEGYTPRTSQAVHDIRARRTREAEAAAAAESLMSSLSEGRLPEPMTPAQDALVQHLKGYAVHGEDYGRSPTARSLLGMAPPTTSDLRRRGFNLLVSAGVFSPDEFLELHRADIDTGFPPDAVEESAAIRLAEHLEDPRRVDLTATPAVTIDDATASDRDDAVSLEPGTDGSDGFLLGIHIADAGTLVSRGGAIDREADRRMSTLYLPERKFEMLPPGFAERLGSLDPGETRAAVSVLVRVSGSGDVTGWEVTPSVVQTRAALTYEGADVALLDPASPWHWMLGHLEVISRALRSRRDEAGAITLDRSEMSIKVAPSGDVDVKVVSRTRTREMVAELMILCNTLLAEFARDSQIPAAYRSQPPADLSGIATETAAERSPVFSRYLVMRRFPPADLNLSPAPHAGLGVAAYIQATSPLRRYPDLVMQRQIRHFLAAQQHLYSMEEVASLAQRAEVQLREISGLEEDRKRYWFLKYLQQTRLQGAAADPGSQDFAAVVLENDPRRRGLLELAEYPHRPRAELPRSVAPGDTVTLRLQGVDLWHRIGHFVFAGPAGQ